eukprot:4910837-Amphidinium_carterae.1
MLLLAAGVLQGKQWWGALRTRCCSNWRVSNLGRVQDNGGRVVTGTVHADRTCTVQIKTQRYCVHRLVAFAHLRTPPTPLHSFVIHRDGVKTNNHVDNLKYATSSECCTHHLQSLENDVVQKPVKRAVFCQQNGQGAWEEYQTVREAAASTGVSAASIYNCCTGRSRSAGGHVFKFAKQPDLPGEVWTAAIDPNTGQVMLGYLVSSLGRVLMRLGNKTLGHKTAQGYRRISVHGHRHFVHRLVAYSFLGAPAQGKDQ